MRSRLKLFVAIAAIVGMCLQTASAQLPHTRLYSIFPPGAQAGTTAEVTVANGVDTDELHALYFSDPGIRAIQKMNGDQPVNNTFVVSVDDQVRPGIHEVRTAGLFGVSNPRAFVVGRTAETNEAEPNAAIEQATPIQINNTINASINGATDVDFFAFDGKKDQRLLVEITALRIDSQLKAAVEVITPDGRRLAHARSTDNQDPIFEVTLPVDGRYAVKVHDASFYGGATFGYRLRVHNDPHIDFILPPAGVAGTRSKFTLYGRNLGGAVSTQIVDGRPLEKLDVEITLPHDEAALTGSIDSERAGIDGFQWTWKNSNPVLIQLSSHPTSLEVEPNDSGVKAQKISVPGSFAGQFQARGDADWYEFEIKEARPQSLFIEVFGHRSGSSADPLLQVEQVTKNDKGEETVKRLTLVDDGANPGGKNFLLSTRDPIFELKAPKPGIYRVLVRDRFFESRGDARMVYRLSIRDPQPDFRLVAYPAVPAAGNVPAATSGLTLRRGGNLAVQILALRRDGFNDPIELVADGLPAGVQAGASVIGTGKTSTLLILSADADAPLAFASIRIAGRTKKLSRTARAATITWTGNQNQANRARISESIGLSVMKDELPFQPVAKATRLEVNQSRQILIPIELLKRAGFDNKVTFAFIGQPKNVDVGNKALEKGQANGIFRMFVKSNAPEGTHLVYLNATGQVSYSRNPWRLEREKVSQTKAVADVAAADVATKKATTDLAVTNKKVLELDAQFKAATAAMLVAVKAAATATAAMTTAKQASDKATASSAATEMVLAATQASLKTTSEQSNSPELTALKDSLTKAVAAAQAAKAKTDTVKTDATTKLAAATTAAQTATKGATDATSKNTAAQNALKAGQDAKAKVEQAVKDTAAAKKVADAAKAAADKRVTDATNAAKPKNINITVPSTPLILTIRKAPIKLTAAVPASGNLKRGQKIDIKITIKRENGFAGPVKIILPLPPGVTDLAAPAVDVPADKTEAILAITAGANATEGQLANMVVRAEMDFNGPAAVDAPIALKVAK